MKIISVLRLLGAGMTILLPWALRRVVLMSFWGYEIDRSARIGWSWIFPESLVMGPESSIGHLNVCKGLARLQLGESATIAHLNWMTAYPAASGPHFATEKDRCPELSIRRHGAVTSRHLLDCTNRISIGAYSTVAGFRSQFLTHSIDLHSSRQVSAPIDIADYCFIGTGVVMLPGSRVPRACAVGALSAYRGQFTQEHSLYSGVPAKWCKQLSSDDQYYCRTTGFVI